MQDSEIKIIKPSRWNFFWLYFFWFLIIPPIIAWVKRRRLKLKIHADRIVLEEGILSKDLRVIFISDIRTIDIKQTFYQRIIKIGDVLIATSGTAGYEDEAKGMPDPASIKDLIMRLRTGEKEPEKKKVEREFEEYRWLNQEDLEW